MGHRQSYPVFVEESTVRMIWIEADNAEDAAKQFSEHPGGYDYGHGTDPVDGWVTGIAPSENTALPGSPDLAPLPGQLDLLSGATRLYAHKPAGGNAP